MLLGAGLVGLAAAASAQQTSLNSHEVNPDHSVTFRYYAPTAKIVTVGLDYTHKDSPMAKGTDGTWTLTTGPLAPELHVYSFKVDEVGLLDPLNQAVEVSMAFFRANIVVVPGAPEPWDFNDVPHGTVHHHVYTTKAVAGLNDNAEDYYVYTPPGYDPAGAKTYPVLYLLHGWAQIAESWVNIGQANLILDNLIAEGRAVPMIIVMPLGYGNAAFVTNGFGGWNDEAQIADNLDRYSKALLTEIKPQVEAAYKVSLRREDRAIAGLSMGGGESLVIGLNHPDLFGAVGGFSSAVVYKKFEPEFAQIDPKLAPSILWVSCGTSDDLIAPNRGFVAWLKSKGFEPTAIETAGIHNWPVWRDNLVHFAPLLFKPAAK
jgi:enterochelin esterase family protein